MELKNWLLIDDQRWIPCGTVARTGLDGLYELAHGEFDGVLVDYSLSSNVTEMTGLDVLRCAEVDSSLPARIAVVSTHYAGRGELINYMQEIGYHPTAEQIKVEGDTALVVWSR